MQLDGTAMPAARAGWQLSQASLGEGQVPGAGADERRHLDRRIRRGSGKEPEDSADLGARAAYGPTDHPARWLTAAMVSLAVLAGTSAVVSFAAQYRMVYTAKGTPAVAALEAGIPDVAALIFAMLGVALALHGRRAVRARVLNVAAVGTSVAMNALAAAPGWRAAAIWVMPPVTYALASDTAIGVSLGLVILMSAFSLVRWHEDGYSCARQASGTCLGGINGG